MTKKTGLEFRILVIVIYLIFDICDLEFLRLHYSKTAGHVYRQSHITPTRLFEDPAMRGMTGFPRKK